MSRATDLIVDLMILDEAHKTVGTKHKAFAHLIFDENITAWRRLFMTATQRIPQVDDDRVLSMDDPAVYGDQFHLLTCKTAVEQKIICDYEIVVMAVSQADVADLVRKNRLVNTGIDGLDQAQAVRLATGIALKKMYATPQCPARDQLSHQCQDLGTGGAGKLEAIRGGEGLCQAAWVDEYERVAGVHYQWQSSA